MVAVNKKLSPSNILQLKTRAERFGEISSKKFKKAIIIEKMKQRAERFNSSDASLSETKVEKSVFKKICELFDLIERATKGKWSRTPNQIDRDLDFIFQSFNVERFHDSRFSFAYNLDINCRQIDIFFWC